MFENGWAYIREGGGASNRGRGLKVGFYGTSPLLLPHQTESRNVLLKLCYLPTDPLLILAERSPKLFFSVIAGQSLSETMQVLPKNCQI